MKEIRLFIAVALPDEVKQELGRVAGILAARVPVGSVRWVQPNLMHLTLRFLGETNVSKLDAIKQTMDKVAQNQSPLSVYLHGIGCFPHAKRPRVVWAGLAGQVPELAAFKRELDGGLQPLDWKVEKRPFRQAQGRPFKPHLTLGRVKNVGKLRGVSWAVDLEAVRMEITAVHLIESELTRQGPIYTPQHISKFAAKMI